VFDCEPPASAGGMLVGVAHRRRVVLGGHARQLGYPAVCVALLVRYPLAIVMVMGGLLAGGIFTIVVLPLALIIIAIAIISALYGLSSRRRTLPSDRSTATGLRGGVVR
jgi:hypothetical protein